jgi:hypothetical protein
MTSEQDWIESSLTAAAKSTPNVDAAIRKMMAELLSKAVSQKALSKAELSAVAARLLASISSVDTKPPEQS